MIALKFCKIYIEWDNLFLSKLKNKTSKCLNVLDYIQLLKFGCKWTQKKWSKRDYQNWHHIPTIWQSVVFLTKRQKFLSASQNKDQFFLLFRPAPPLKVEHSWTWNWQKENYISKYYLLRTDKYIGEIWSFPLHHRTSLYIKVILNPLDKDGISFSFMANKCIQTLSE